MIYHKMLSSIVRILFILFVFNTLTIASEKIVTFNLKEIEGPVKSGMVAKLHFQGDVADTWHINGNKPNQDFLIPTEFIISDSDLYRVKEIQYPNAESVTLSFLDEPLLVYSHRFDIIVSLELSENISVQEVPLKGILSYQGCNDKTCVQPEEDEISVIIPLSDASAVQKGDTAAEPEPSVMEKTAPDEQNQTLSAQEKKAKEDISKGLFWAILTFFLAGLGLNLTPCVYPVIPITVSFFGSQGEQSKGNRFIVALVYTLGIAIIFTLLGLISSLAGKQWGFLFQNPWFLISLSMIMFLMAASMFGAFEIKVPTFLMTKMGKSREGIFGALIMGLTVGFVIAPCAAGFIIGLVGLVAKEGLVIKGAILFFFMGLGLGLPYLLLASFSGLLGKIPRSGMWMIWIRKLFGIILIGVGFHFLTPLISRIPQLETALLGLTVLYGGLLLGFFDHNMGYTARFNKGRGIFGIILIAFGIFMLQGAIAEMGKTGSGTHAESPIAWHHYKGEPLENLKQEGKPLIIDFYADWCTPCKAMDRKTFRDDSVVTESKRFVMIKVDCTAPDGPVRKLMKQFNAVGMPTIVFLDSDVREIEELRISEYTGPEDFLSLMKKVP